MLALLWIGAVVAVIIAWFAILFTGHHPRGLFGYVQGVIRWGNRVTAYAFLLVTDRYPRFSCVHRGWESGDASPGKGADPHGALP